MAAGAGAGVGQGTGVPPSLLTSWTAICNAMLTDNDKDKDGEMLHDAATRAVHKLMRTGTGMQQEEHEEETTKQGGTRRRMER